MKKQIIFFFAGFLVPVFMALVTPAIAMLYLHIVQKSPMLLMAWLTFVMISAWVIIFLFWKKPHVIEHFSPKFIRNTTNKEIGSFTSGLGTAIFLMIVFFFQNGESEVIKNSF